MFDFKPNTDRKQATVPYFDEVQAVGGWEGQATGKRMDDLLSELSAAMSRLNGLIINVAEGTYGDRCGFQIHFSIKTETGQMLPGRLDIACLPLKSRRRQRTSWKHTDPIDPRIEKTKKMALYMVIKAIKGMWFLEQRSEPGLLHTDAGDAQQQGTDAGPTLAQQRRAHCAAAGAEGKVP